MDPHPLEKEVGEREREREKKDSEEHRPEAPSNFSPFKSCHCHLPT